MPEQFVMRLYVAVSLPRIHGALHTIADPLLTIVYTNVTAIMTNYILDNCDVTSMGLIIYQVKACID
ncbi:hypothetical protein ASV06_08480 [Enterobacter hormaechei subsp. xiangfangensis]|nr:hypothetical protein ASV06_08480 [Enterobacter hormaechei subsp. xiangfangensis]